MYDAPFRLIAQSHPHLYAYWDSHQEQWTLYDRPADEHGEPDPFLSFVADAETTLRFKEAARIGVSQLRDSCDPDIRAVASTLREPMDTLLDLMRTKGRGFRRIPQLRGWCGGRAMEAFRESGVVPSDARLTQNGVIHQVSQVSADLLDDLKARGIATETSAQAEVDAFLQRCSQELSMRIPRKFIWLAAGHKSGRQFQYFQAGSPQATEADRRTFRRILSTPPTQFLELLKKKGII